jgi:hypothetical protein
LELLVLDDVGKNSIDKVARLNPARALSACESNRQYVLKRFDVRDNRSILIMADVAGATLQAFTTRSRLVRRSWSPRCRMWSR